MIKKLSNTSDNQNSLANYLHDVDNDFEIPLSKKTDIDAYSIKILGNGVVFVSMENDNINGLLAGYCNDIENGNAIISILSVKKSFRGRGISRLLVNSMIEICQQTKMKKIYVDSVNPIAVAIYKSCNFIIDRVEAHNEISKTYLVYNLI